MKMTNYVGKQLLLTKINVGLYPDNSRMSMIRFTNKDGLVISLPVSRNDVEIIADYLKSALDGKGDSY